METKVLVADSSAKVRKNIARSLNEIGVQNVVEASDGNEAIKLFQTGTYDLVFAEWSNVGTKLAEEIRKVNGTLPIIITAPESKNKQDLKSYCPGASDMLSTPFKTEEFRKKVEKYIPTLAG
jgi:two-component system chemotaxis response regulator CheY